MERVAIGVQVHRIEVDRRRDLVAEKRQVQLEPGPEKNAVERLGIAVVEGHVQAGNRCQPGPYDNPTLRDQRKVLLAEGHAGGEQRRIRRRRAVLLGAAAGFHDDLLQLAVDLGLRQRLVGQHAVSGEDAMVRWHSGRELGQHIALSPLRHRDVGGAGLREFGGDLQSADGAAGDEDASASIALGSAVGEGGDRALGAGERVEAWHRRDHGRPESAAGHHHLGEALGDPVVFDDPAGLHSVFVTP